MKTKPIKKNSGFGLSSKLSQLTKKNCPLAKNNASELTYTHLNLLRK